MEKFYLLLTSFEAKLGTLFLFYSTLVVLGVFYIRWKRKGNNRPASDGTESYETANQNTIRKKVKILIITSSYMTVFVFMIALIIRIVTPVARVRSMSPANNSELRYNSPITVEMDVPVDLNKIQVNVNPKLDVTVKALRYFPNIPYARFITINPKYSFPPDQKIMVYLSNIKNPLSEDFGSEYLIEYKTSPLPNITSVEPKNNAREVALNSEIIVQLNNRDTPQNIWDLKVEPEIPYEIARNQENNFKIQFNGSLHQNTLYRLTFFRTPASVDLPTKTIIPSGERSKVYETTFTTRKAPFISSFQPGGDGILPQAPIEVVFDESMDKASVETSFFLEPNTKVYDYFWKEDNTVLTISHSDFAKDTAYTARFDKRIKSKSGESIETAITFAFHTIGKVLVTDPTPANTDSIPTNMQIRIPFNQEVDHADAEKKFSIIPAIEGAFAWEESSMIFSPKKPFASGTRYKYRIEIGVKSVNGLPSDQVFEYWFSTGPLEFTLPVPFYFQEELFTCNISAARQLLAFRGILISEQQLKSDIGLMGTRGNGDPNKGYVSNYGTYWDPIAKGVGKYRPVRVYKDWGLTELLSEVEKGNPVMTWGQNGWSDPHEISWKNPDGTKIYAINGMHSAVIRGFRGPKENPSQILINDPWRGTYFLNTQEFMRRWSYFKVAMVVD